MRLTVHDLAREDARIEAERRVARAAANNEDEAPEDDKDQYFEDDEEDDLDEDLDPLDD